MSNRELKPEAQAELDAFAEHLAQHKEASAPDCRFCAEREDKQTEAAIRGLRDLMDGAKDAAVRGVAACALGVIQRLRTQTGVPRTETVTPNHRALSARELAAAEMICDIKHPPSIKAFIRTGGCPTCRADVVRLVDGPALPVVREEDARSQFWRAVCAEIDHAYAKHGREPWGRHEFFAIMREEVDEVWDDVKADSPTEALLKEVVQVAAMCLRYAETGDRYRGAHPAIPSRAILESLAPRQGGTNG